MNPQQNQIMQVQQPAQAPAQPPSMVSALDNMPLVNYVKVISYGVTIFNGLPACMLEWTTANRIRLVRIDENTNRPLGLELDVDPSQITKVKISFDYLYITAAGRHLKLNFNSRASSFLLAGAAASPFIGLAALAAQGNAAKDKGIHWWYENLRAYAPYAKSGNLGVTYIIIGAISVVALVLLVFIVAIISSMK
jgi:hypothetical protein